MPLIYMQLAQLRKLQRYYHGILTALFGSWSLEKLKRRVVNNQGLIKTRDVFTCCYLRHEISYFP